MGQAKQRGTFEERRQQAEESLAATRVRIAAAWEAMPEAQKEKYRNRPNGTRMMDAVILAAVLCGAMQGRVRR